MKILRPHLHAIIRDTRGANLVEYLILVGVIALVALAGMQAFGRAVDTKIRAQMGTVNSI